MSGSRHLTAVVTVFLSRHQADRLPQELMPRPAPPLGALRIEADPLGRTKTHLHALAQRQRVRLLLMKEWVGHDVHARASFGAEDLDGLIDHLTRIEVLPVSPLMNDVQRRNRSPLPREIELHQAVVVEVLQLLQRPLDLPLNHQHHFAMLLAVHQRIGLAQRLFGQLDVTRVRLDFAKTERGDKYPHFFCHLPTLSSNNRIFILYHKKCISRCFYSFRGGILSTEVRMQTIQAINDQIRKTQDLIDAENRAAQTERDKADTYRINNDVAQAQGHGNTALQHEQKAVQLQATITQLMNEQQQLQSQLADLDQQKNQVVASRDAELFQIDSQIDKIRGGA